MMRATVETEAGTQAIRLAQDGEVWVWYDQEGNDTGVSSKTPEGALREARLAWADWSFTLEPER